MLANSLLVLIKLYRVFLSPLFGQNCRFHPSCSSYAEQALENHGFGRGVYLSLKRLLKCHPWNKGGIDPVPPCSAKTAPNSQTEIHNV